MTRSRNAPSTASSIAAFEGTPQSASSALGFGGAPASRHIATFEARGHHATYLCMAMLVVDGAVGERDRIGVGPERSERIAHDDERITGATLGAGSSHPHAHDHRARLVVDDERREVAFRKRSTGEAPLPSPV